jgi:N-succinyldiaminopimelate aminotransferase
VNPDLARLQPYPFEKLRHLFAGVAPAPSFREIKLSIGEPQHPTPPFIQRALADNLAGLANYPTTQGSDALRQAIAAWIARRYGVPLPDFMTQVVPVNGSREALFAFAQAVIDRSRSTRQSGLPQPLLPDLRRRRPARRGATGIPQYRAAQRLRDGLGAHCPESTWRDVQLVYVCSPGNPTGKVMDLAAWKSLFELSDRHGFVIASDECYSEIYFDEAQPPLGGLAAAAQLGRHDYRNLVAFSSLSKRSNVPGLRSGFVAGDAAILKKFLLYRTYHGSAMNPGGAGGQHRGLGRRGPRARQPPHVRRKIPRGDAAGRPPPRLPDSRRRLLPLGQDPDRRHRLRPRTAAAEERRGAARQLSGARGRGINPGANFIRIALVASHEECLDAAQADQRFLSVLVTPMASKATLES